MCGVEPYLLHFRADVLPDGVLVEEVGECEREWWRVVSDVLVFLGGGLPLSVCEVFYCSDDPPTVFTCGVELSQVFGWFECYFPCGVDAYDPCSLEHGESEQLLCVVRGYSGGYVCHVCYCLWVACIFII